MPTNTTYKPIKVSDFEANKLNFDARGIFTQVNAGSTTCIDYDLTDDCLITGACVITSNAEYGDNTCFQVVDKTGAFTGNPNTVLNQFISNWYVCPTSELQLDIPYPAKILAGMTLRLVYSSTGQNNVFVAINYNLHKVMV